MKQTPNKKLIYLKRKRLIILVKMQWILEGETTPQEIKEFINTNPLRSRGPEFWVKASDKFLEKQTPILDNDEGKKNVLTFYLLL